MSKEPQSAELEFFRNLGGDALVDDIKAYEAYLKKEQRKSAKQRQPNAPWKTVGEVIDFRAYEGGMHFECEHGLMDVRWVSEGCVRVLVQHGAELTDIQEPHSYAIRDTQRSAIRYELLEDDEAIIIQSRHLICRVFRHTGSVSLYRRSGDLLAGDGSQHLFRADGTVRLSMDLKDSEASYGLGERTHSLNLRGERYVMWNTDQPNCDRGMDPIYYCVPFYMGLHDKGAYGVFWDNSARGFVDVGAEKADQIAFEAEEGALCYYLIGGDTVADVVVAYTDLTGRIHLPPLWHLGFQQSRFSYYPQSRVLELAKEFRERRIPCDALYLDIHYMDAFKVMTWDEERFPDFVGMVKSLHQQGFKLIPIIDPAVKIEEGYETYESGLERDVYLKTPEDEPIQAVVWAGASHMPDFTNPETRVWWTEQLETLIKTGIDGIWNDMNEPGVFATTTAVTLPDTAQHNKEGMRGDHIESHNTYGMLMSRASREALEKHRPGKRQVNITRAGSAGTQRYAYSWTGDVTSDWDHLRLSIPMILNMGLSGNVMTGSDIGGFRDSTNAELLTRWTQAGALMPFFRNHSAIDTEEQEPWAFGEPYESIIRETIELRYQLMPYLYSVVAQAAEYGLPIARPMLMVDPEMREIDDQFMLGDALLVAPIVEEGTTQRKVVLPNADWYDFWTNELVVGGRTITVDAPLERLPLYVRGGAVLPMWEVMQHLDNPNPQKLYMRIYPGKLDMTLYEDDGEGLEYMDGKYRWVYLASEWVNNRFQVKRRVTGQYEPSYSDIKLDIIGFDEEPTRVTVNRQGAPVWYYENKLIELTVKEFESLEVHKRIGPDDETVVHRPLGLL